MKIIIISLFSFLGFTSLLADEEFDLSQFLPIEDAKPYEARGWPGLDFHFFTMSAAQFYLDHEKWPGSTSDLDDGFRSLIESMATEEEKAKLKDDRIFQSFTKTFEINEIIQMKDGVAYRLTYLKLSAKSTGLIYLEEGETREEILDSEKVSKNFGDAMYAVPF